MWTAFDYLYRDAANFKAFGSTILTGSISPRDRTAIRERLSGGEFFIAEQIGVPPLYGQLYKWSDGPTADDHCWHEFVDFRELAQLGQGSVLMSATDFVTIFMTLQGWVESLSPHFWLESQPNSGSRHAE